MNYLQFAANYLQFFLGSSRELPAVRSELPAVRSELPEIPGTTENLVPKEMVVSGFFRSSRIFW